MGTQLERLSAYATAVADQNPTAPVRIRLSDVDALALVNEIGFAALRHADAATKAAADLSSALVKTAPAASDLGGLVEWAKAIDRAQAAFWDAVNGEVINGVEILRKVS